MSWIPRKWTEEEWETLLVFCFLYGAVALLFFLAGCFLVGIVVWNLSRLFVRAIDWI